VFNRERIESIADNTRTLREYYRRKLAAQPRLNRARVDALLRSVFPAPTPAPGRGRKVSAAALLRAHKASLRSALERYAGADRYAAQQLVRLAIERCRQLDLQHHGARRPVLPRLRSVLVRLARGYVAGDALRLRL
jgi:hypothetical protein